MITMENFINFFDYSDFELINSLTEKIEADNEDKDIEEKNKKSKSRKRNHRKTQRAKAQKKNKFPVPLRKEIYSERRCDKTYKHECKHSRRSDSDSKILKQDLRELEVEDTNSFLEILYDDYLFRQEYKEYLAGMYDDDYYVDDYDDYDDYYDDYDDDDDYNDDDYDEEETSEFPTYDKYGYPELYPEVAI